MRGLLEEIISFASSASSAVFIAAARIKKMPLTTDQRAALAARVKYAREMGLGDFYRCEPKDIRHLETLQPVETRHAASQTRDVLPVVNKSAALTEILDDIGECTRCRLHKGRTKLVFGVGNVNADIMFIGEGPGADEDKQGEPFVGRAGQLLNNMITAMGIRREDVYIANVVKCRPPDNRTPEKDECDTCSPFLMRQIEVVQPKMIVALGAVAAKNLLGINDSMGNLRGKIYDFKGTKLVATYHPAYLLRDPRQKAEAWKDLQMVMRELGMAIPSKPKV
jgi:DNA polymerase